MAALLPPPDGSPATAGYLAPEVGFDAAKDAAALIRCAAAGDGEGLVAVLNGTGHPRQVAGQTALLAAAICRRAGLTETVIAALLTEATSHLGDFLLDQPAPGGD